MKGMAILKKLLTLTGWKQFFKILSQKERIIFLIISAIFLASLFIFSVNFYFKNTEISPAAGGKLTEGLTGQPRFINPIYASPNDVDRDLSELLFSGLVKYDENEKIVPDLAENIEIGEDGKTYNIRLKDSAFWSDSASKSKTHKLTADDVVFTIKTIQNPDYKSPLRANWLGVEVEKISDYDVSFKLKNSYSNFLENLTLKILPKHIWQSISPQQFPLSFYNLKPVGSGPYKFAGISQEGSGYIKSLSLKINSRYYGKKPHISEIDFIFFDKESSLINAAKSGEIDSFSVVTVNKKELPNASLFKEYRMSLPRYFAVFFNPEKSKILSDVKVRQALNYATDKNEIIEKLLDPETKIVDSPILPDIYGFEAPVKTYPFDLDKANSLLEDAGFKEKESGVREKIIDKKPAFQFKSDLQTGSRGTEVEELQKCLAKDAAIYPEGEITGLFGQKTKEAVVKFQEKYKSDILTPSGLTQGTGTVRNSTRKKLNELCTKPTQEITVLKLVLVTVNQPLMSTAANLLKERWEVLGADIEVKTFDDISDIIKPRDYEAILFGEALGEIPDLFPFWHSLQRKDPGLNLSAYSNKEADKLLEDARQTLDDEERQRKLEKFQNILIADAPAVFLYSPDYLYFASKKIGGIKEKMITDPSKRLSAAENWYIKTKRTWK